MEANELINLDDLSGLYNRRAFKEILRKDLSNPQALSKGLLVAFTDLDHFKRINDTYGHLSGDFMIKEFSKAIVEGLKGTDCTIARYGGDEFVMILRGFDAEMGFGVFDEIRSKLCAREFVLPADNAKIKVTLSMGIAQYPFDGKSVDALLDRADEALYSSKEAGRNRVSLAKDILAQVKESKRIQNNISRPPFTGREAKVKEAEDYFFGQEQYKIVLFGGDVGSGKSRILEEVSARIASHKLETLVINCTENQKSHPFSLISDIINAISYRHLDPCKKSFDSLDKDQKESFVLLPQLKVLTEGLNLPSEPAANARMYLFQGLCELLIKILEQNSIVLLIDNLDCMDEATAGVLSYLVVSDKKVPLKICATDSRLPVGAKGECFLDRMLFEISEFEIVPKINLDPLSAADTSHLVRGIFSDIGVPETFLAKLYATTKGNPYFITELLRDLMNSQAISFKSSQWSFSEDDANFPRSLKELLLKKIDTLNQEEKEFLLAAAGIGQSCKFGFLLELKKMNQGYGEDILEKITENNIITRSMVAEGQVVVFNNGLLRDLLYNNTSEDKKKELHQVIAEKLEEKNRENLEIISSELAYHFERAHLQAKVKEYSQLAFKYLDKLFSDREIDRFMDDLIKQREEKDRQEPIQKESWPLLLDIVSAFNSVIKSIQSYQKVNEVSSKMARSIIDAFVRVFKFQSSITFSSPEGDTQDFYRLMVNGQDFHTEDNIQQIVAKRLIEIMRDFDIGSITFKRSIAYEEIEAFALLLSNPKSFKENKRPWKELLREAKITSIKIDDILYKRVLSTQEQKNLHKEVMKDFMANKVVMDDTVDMLRESGEPGMGGGGGVSAAGGLIEEVTPEEKSILVKVIARLPAATIAECIEKEYAERKRSISDIKEMVGVCLKNSSHKKEFLMNLQTKLKAMGMSNESLAWLVDHEEFMKYPLKKRINIYLNTDAKTLLEIGVTENLKPTLEEVFNLKDDKIAADIIDKYLKNLDDEREEFRAYVGETFGEVLQIFPERFIQPYSRNLSAALLANLKTGKNPPAYVFVAKNTHAIIDNLRKCSDYVNIYRVLLGMKEFITFAESSKDEQVVSAARMLLQADPQELIKEAITALDTMSLDKDKGKAIFSMLELLMPKSIPYMMEMLLKRQSVSLPFEWYMQNNQVMEMFKRNKEATLAQMEVSLFSSEENKVALSLEILKQFPCEEMEDFYEKALSGGDKNVRFAVAKSLAEVDNVYSIRILENHFRKADPETQRQIISNIGFFSKNALAVKFLSDIKNLSVESGIKKMALSAIDSIEKRSKTK